MAIYLGVTADGGEHRANTPVTQGDGCLPRVSVAGGWADGADRLVRADTRHLPVGDPSADGRFLTHC